MTDLTYAWGDVTPALSTGACTDYAEATKPMPLEPRVVFTVDAVAYLIHGNDVVGLPSSMLDGGRWTYHLTIASELNRIAYVDAVRDE